MSYKSVRSRAAAAALVTAGLVAGGIVAAPAAMASTQRVPIAGTHPTWAVSHGRHAAPAVTSGTVDARVYLAGRDAAGLSAYAAAVSTPGSRSYGHYLTPTQVRARYSPSTGQVTAVEAWLRSAGLRVTGVDSQIAGYVGVAGSVAEASRAFGVSFGRFTGPDGHTYRAPDASATAPAAVAPAVLTVSGLDNAPHLMRPEDSLPPPRPNYWIPKPCSDYYGQRIAANKPTAYGKNWPWTNCGYTQAQIRGAYGVTSSGMTGKGQTIAIVDAYASPTMPGDANEFAKVTGDKPFQPGQYRQYPPAKYTDTKSCGAAGWYGEESLDIEAAHGQAPDADIHFVPAASCTDTGLGDALALIVNHHLASIVSNSWSDLQSGATLISVYELIFQAGAAEGIGFYFSSGDNGYESPGEDAASKVQQLDYPTASPWVTAVGGTSLAIGKSGNYEWETSWGTLLDPLATTGTSWSTAPPGAYPAGYDGSSGGGTSTVYRQPAYQKGVVPLSLSEKLPNGTVSLHPMREVPDVSALADPSTGMLVGETIRMPNGKTYAFALSRIGGTSVSCPTFAGIEADAQQAAGHVFGFANPVIYARYGTSAFHDVTDHPLGAGPLAEVRGNYTNGATKKGPLLYYLRTLGVDGEGTAALPAVKGYDDSTGVGSPALYIQSFEPKA